MVLLGISDNILMSMDSQKITSVVHTDLFTAFDTVNIEILLVVLEKSYGVQGRVLSCCTIYLMKRQARVKIKHELSAESDISFSVPEGSVLGPVLFMLHVCTLSYEIRDLQLLLSGYVNDHGAHNSFNMNSRKEEEYSNQRLELTLSITKYWMDANCLKINISKMEYIRFGNPRQLGKCISNSINFEDIQIKQASSFRNLGIEMDKHLNYPKHITNKCNQVHWYLSKIRNLRPHLSVENATQLVLFFVISHIDFSNGLLAGLPNRSIKILQCAEHVCKSNIKQILQR